MSKPAAGDPKTPSSSSSDAAGRVLRRFRQVYTAARNHFNEVEKVVGIGGAHLWALGAIGANPGLGMNALAREMQVHQSTASNLVRALIERGLVRTERDETDRRAVRLSLLPAGTDLLARAPGPVSGLLTQALGTLDARTLSRLESDLERLSRQMGIAEDAPAPPITQR
ncbi:MAG: MarR family winged helix-turn-helix transcriptional regulator [Rubrivivax sp.]|nr:MarR family winged helix-turn-helix transcriptional regulator [Rubrivivax sp.]MDH5340446.1 MarR family winged helix-turn-helix transcriptional regulator [Rubrivivax sp.]